MFKKISLILGFLMILLVGSVTAFDNGYLIKGNTFDEVLINSNFTYNFNVYDSDTGVLINDAECFYHLYSKDSFDDGEYSSDVTFDSTKYSITKNMNTSGEFTIEIRCADNETDQTKGGFENFDFRVEETGMAGLWKPVENWTFPIVYLILTFIVIGLGLYYESSILGVFGSIMLVFAYFLIGATSPLLFAPLLIIGLLLGFRFATI